METIWALLLTAEMRISVWKWIDVHGLSLCTSYLAAALKDLNQLHKGERRFTFPQIPLPTSDLPVLTVCRTCLQTLQN